MSSSWLRNHIRHWVVPGLKLLSQHHRQDLTQEGYFSKRLAMPAGVGQQPTTSDLVAMTSLSDYRPLSLRPSKKCKRPEAGLVYSAVSSFYPRHPLLRQEALRILRECDPSTFMDESRLTYSKADGYKSSDVAHSIIKSSWRALKDIAGGKTILLPGRDVWPWEVMAQRDRYPTVYDPRISRLFCFGGNFGGSIRVELLRKVCLEEWGVNLADCIIFDTGFMGSIPAAIRKATGIDVPHLMLSSEEFSHHNTGREWTQIFPNHKGARSKVLCIEYFPKYQKSGTVKGGRNHPLAAPLAPVKTPEQPVQYLSDSLEFIKAAALTIWIWHHQSPRYIRHGKHQLPDKMEGIVPKKKEKICLLVD